MEHRSRWILVRRPLILTFAVLAALAVAPDAFATADARVTSLELTRSGERTFESGTPTRFTLAGVHWRGRGAVSFRTRSTGGRWSAWRAAAPEVEDGPDARSPERRAKGWRLGNPWWVGDADRIQRAGQRTGDESARPSRLEPRDAHPPEGARRHGRAADRAARVLGCRREDSSWATELRGRCPLLRRAPHRREERLLALRGAPRSSRASSCSTSRETAGTTSATTFSSTASERSTRVVSGASTAT